jgi:3-oxoacyl-[acyl-carrier protein] reductase
MPREQGAALVTGGGRGLGRAIAERLAAEGLMVGVLARTPREVESTAAAIHEAGGAAKGLPADVLDPASLERAFERFTAWSGGCDVLVCAAGRLQAIGPMETVDPDAWWLDLETSVRGTQRTIRTALPSLRDYPERFPRFSAVLRSHTIFEDSSMFCGG